MAANRMAIGSTSRWSSRRSVLKHILMALLLSVAVSTSAIASGTGYVFVSHEKTNNIAVIDPKQDYRIIKWIDTSHRPRDMNFRHGRTQLLVACGDDDVIDVIDIGTLQVVDHIPSVHHRRPVAR